MPSSQFTLPNAVATAENKGITNPIIIKPYSTKELSILYGVSTKTFGKWLVPHREEVGMRIGRFYNALQVKKIFMVLGAPSTIFMD